MKINFAVSSTRGGLRAAMAVGAAKFAAAQWAELSDRARTGADKGRTARRATLVRKAAIRRAHIWDYAE